MALQLLRKFIAKKEELMTEILGMERSISLRIHFRILGIVI